MLVGGKGVGGLGEAVGEVLPADDAGEVEERLGEAVGGDLRDAAEDDHEHDRGEGGLDEEPRRAEDGLLVLGDDVALDEEGEEVAVVPELAQVEAQEGGAGGDDGGPIIGHGGGYCQFFFTAKARRPRKNSFTLWFSVPSPLFSVILCFNFF